MKVVVFDLDDTIYKEVEYLTSAFREIRSFISLKYNVNISPDFMIQSYHKGENVFSSLIQEYNVNCSIDDLLSIYRLHVPNIKLEKEILDLLTEFRKRDYIVGLITDGRSITQRNKIKSLELNSYIENKNIIISEEFGYSKPSKENYLFFQNLYPDQEYFYIADNPKKDFISPNKLGWSTICLLDNGQNIHKQDFNLEEMYLPQIKIKTIRELIDII